MLALAVIAGAYWMGRSAGPGGDVGEEAAKSAARSHAGIAESQLSSYRIARDEEGGAQVYEVEFTADGVAYDYVVSAATGSIVKFSRDAEESVPPPEVETPAPEGGDVGEARAWEIAYAHAGVAAEAAAALPAERDYESGVPVYEDTSLATMLSQLSLGQEIPESLYRAIVEIYVYFLEFDLTDPDKARRQREEAAAARKAAEEEAARQLAEEAQAAAQTEKGAS